MERELWKGPKLQSRPKTTPIRPIRMKQLENLLHIDIYYIGPTGFHQTTKQLDATIFITSLYEIDQMIEEKEIEAIWDDLAQ
jgi:hypothetical protein